MRKAISWLVPLALAGPVAAAEPTGYVRPPPAVNRARVALLVDLSSGQVLHEQASRSALLPASMTKVMTAFIAFEAIKAGRVREDTIVTIRPELAARWSGKGTSLALRPGERVRLSDLLLATTAASANDAAAALAEASAGSAERHVALAEHQARRLGMRRSWFRSANGMPDAGATITSAEDMAILAKALIERHPLLYRRYFGQPGILWRGTMLRNRDPLTGVVAGADGIKTGHTREAGYNFLGSLERDGRRLVLVIGGAQSEADRAAAARALAEWGYSAWQSRMLAPAGWRVGAARVQNGGRREVGLILPRAARYALPRGGTARLSARIAYRGPLRAPIRKGSEVARLELRVEGLRGWSLPLVAAEEVPAAGAIDRVVNGLLGLFE